MNEGNAVPVQPATRTRRSTWSLFAGLVCLLFGAVVLLSSVVGAFGLLPDERWTAKPDVQFRLVAAPDCSYCKSVENPHDGPGATIRLGAVIVRAQDIASVSRSKDGDVAIDFLFAEASKRRILDATRDLDGSDVALLAGDRVVTVLRVRGPLSDRGVTIGLDVPFDQVMSEVAEPAAQRDDAEALGNKIGNLLFAVLAGFLMFYGIKMILRRDPVPA